MRALFLTHSFPREPGDAAGSFVLKLAVALRDQGIDVHVVAPSGDHLPSTDTFDGIPVERFRYAPRKYEKLAYTGNMHTQVRDSWGARLALLGFLGSEFGSAVRARRIFEPDVVHAHWWFPGGLVGTWDTPAFVDGGSILLFNGEASDFHGGRQFSGVDTELFVQKSDFSNFFEIR